MRKKNYIFNHVFEPLKALIEGGVVGHSPLPKPRGHGSVWDVGSKTGPFYNENKKKKKKNRKEKKRM